MNLALQKIRKSMKRWMKVMVVTRTVGESIAIGVEDQKRR
jgi:hypothetical protein